MVLSLFDLFILLVAQYLERAIARQPRLRIIVDSLPIRILVRDSQDFPKSLSSSTVLHHLFLEQLICHPYLNSAWYIQQCNWGPSSLQGIPMTRRKPPKAQSFQVTVSVSFHILLTYSNVERILARSSLNLMLMLKKLHFQILDKAAKMAILTR